MTLPRNWIDAACTGDLPKLKQLYKAQSRGLDLDLVLRILAIAGHLKALKWCYGNIPLANRPRVPDRGGIIDNAAQCGQLEVIQWIHKNENEDGICTTDAIDLAAKYSYESIARWLHEHRTDGCSNKALIFAARDEQGFSLGKWLLRVTNVSFEYALRYLAVNQIEDDDSPLVRVFEMKYPNTNESEIDRLLAQPPSQEWDRSPEAMDIGPKDPELVPLLYLYEHHYSGWSSRMDYAAAYGRLDVVKWLHENTDEGCTTLAMDLAAENGHFDVIRWLHDHRTEGCSTNAMDRAAAKGHFDILRWIHKNRTEGCTANAMNNAKNLEIMRWLYDHRTEGCTADALFRVVYFASDPFCTDGLEMWTFLVEHYPEKLTELLRDVVNTPYEWGIKKKVKKAEKLRLAKP